ncbi:MAG: T9SS type A sorting domain-containing protein [Bacteroidetes bacterium]|nr:MAG: T9SS type A sorting domain-containing protein [Bacteroidota bacterium]
MKKRFLLAAVVGVATGISAMAQSPVRVDGGNDGAILVPYSPLQVQPGSTMNKKGAVTEWYNFVNSSSNGGISYTSLSNASLFPDSTVKQLYGSTGGGVELGYAGLHNVGQVFDPKSFYYDQILSDYNEYTVDSIEIAFKYMHNIPGTVDTVDIRVYSGAGVRVGNLVDQNGNVIEPTAWIMYSRALEMGTGSTQNFQLLLDETDTGFAAYQGRTVGLNSPLLINGGELIAVSYRFIPGYAWNFGDTLQHDWDSPEPTNKLNHFIAWVLRDNSKTAEDSYNHGLSVRKFQRYGTTTSWDEEFIPGDAWNDFTEQVYCGFHISSPNVSAQSVNALGGTKVYPNPSNGNAELNIEYNMVNASDVTIELFDMQGRKVRTILNTNVEAGTYTATTNISDLQNGVYVYTITAGEQTTSGKVSVVK